LITNVSVFAAEAMPFVSWKPPSMKLTWT